MLRLLLLSTALLACSSTGTTTRRAKPAPLSEPVRDQLALHEGLPPTVYSGDGGLQVALIPLADDDSQVDRALLRFSGTPHEMVGKVLMATRNGSTDHYSWRVRFDGLDYAVLSLTMRRYGEESKLEVTFAPPRLDSRIPVLFDAEATEALDVAQMVADHRKHIEAGVLERLGQVDRDFHIAEINRFLKRTIQEITRDCQQALPLEVDFDSYSDEQINQPNSCARDLRAIATVCRRDEASRRAVVSQVKGVVCEYADSPSVRLGSDRVLHLGQSAAAGWKSKQIFERLRPLLALTNTVVRDEEGRVLTFSPEANDGDPIYFGDGKTMRRLAKAEFASGYDAWGPIESSRLTKVEDGWTARCPERPLVLFRPVDDKTRLDVLNNATYIDEPLWKYRPFALARDDRGIYYYVDNYAEEFGGQNFRVFRGPRGQVRATTLTDIVDDSNGLIFATKEGKLRLILGKGDAQDQAMWIDGEKQRKLVSLPIRANKALIYNGLGAYDGERLGTICQ